MEEDLGHLKAKDHWGFVQSGLHLSVDFAGWQGEREQWRN